MRKKILCIEDDLETACLIAEEFEERGYEIALAHDGQAGFSAVLKEQPDIVLCDALEKLAAARGAKDITVEASDTASGFFEKRGYVPKTRNTVTVGGEWIANTTMVKPLAVTAGAAKGSV